MMDEARIREIAREEIEAAPKSSVPASACVALRGEKFDDEHVRGLIAQINQAIRDGADLTVCLAADAQPSRRERPA